MAAAQHRNSTGTIQIKPAPSAGEGQADLEATVRARRTGHALRLQNLTASELAVCGQSAISLRLHRSVGHLFLNKRADVRDRAVCFGASSKVQVPNVRPALGCRQLGCDALIAQATGEGSGIVEQHLVFVHLKQTGWCTEEAAQHRRHLGIAGVVPGKIGFLAPNEPANRDQMVGASIRLERSIDQPQVRNWGNGGNCNRLRQSAATNAMQQGEHQVAACAVTDQTDWACIRISAERLIRNSGLVEGRWKAMLRSEPIVKKMRSLVGCFAKL